MCESVWQTIKNHSGDTFYTKTGIPFSYHIRNEYVVLENTNRSIPRKQIEEAITVQSDKVTDYNKYQGYAYLFGLIHDPRIIAGLPDK